MRLIDAGYLRKMFLAEKKYELTGNLVRDIEAVLRCIADCPEIDTIKHGHWIFEETNGRYSLKCSECSHSEPIMTAECWNYCPHCGAKMFMERR